MNPTTRGSGAVRLRLGARIEWEEEIHEVIGFNDTGVRLRSESGALNVILTSALLADPTFRLPDAPQAAEPDRKAQLSASALLDDLDDDHERARILALEESLLEATTGYPTWTGEADGLTPREGYDPRAVALSARVKAMAGELGLSERALWKVIDKWKTGGLWALVDKRRFKTSNPLAGADPRIINAILDQDAAEIDDSTGTLGRFHRRVQNRLNAQHGEGAVTLPSRATFYRWVALLLKNRHTFGDATARRTTANQPDRMFGHLVAHRPGEVVMMDTTPLDVRAYDPATDTTSAVELTIALDLASRSLLAWRITPVGTNAFDIGLLLADMMTPEPMRPGWPDRLRYEMSRIPLPRRLDYSQRLAQGAARPVVIPETLIIDHGRPFDSDVVHRACTRLGINLQLGRKAKPTDKPQVEAVFATIRTQFSQHVAGYKGYSVATRGKNPDLVARWSIADLEEFFAEYVVHVYQRRHHSGLIMPGFPDYRMSPNEAYALAVGRSGYVACPTDPALYYDLMPIQWRTIQHYGVEYRNLTYDAPILHRYRRAKSPYPGGKWPLRTDPRNLLHAYFQDPHDGQWHVLRWTHAEDGQSPFTDVTLREALRLVIARGRDSNDQAEVAQALLELNNKTDAPESWTTTDRRRRARDAERARTSARDQHRAAQATQDAAASRLPTLPPLKAVPDLNLDTDEDQPTATPPRFDLGELADLEVWTKPTEHRRDSQP
ncbi:transposase [Kitasatospora sp. NPDC058478]|uniref:transposase n=1 Tax=unclassified Kitasatospora TaxID=2633591 RepID=UPI00365C8705